jgi:hypothetical protein
MDPLNMRLLQIEIKRRFYPEIRGIGNIPAGESQRPYRPGCGAAVTILERVLSTVFPKTRTTVRTA